MYHVHEEKTIRSMYRKHVARIHEENVRENLVIHEEYVPKACGKKPPFEQFQMTKALALKKKRDVAFENYSQALGRLNTVAPMQLSQRVTIVG